MRPANLRCVLSGRPPRALKRLAREKSQPRRIRKILSLCGLAGAMDFTGKTITRLQIPFWSMRPVLL